MSFFAKWKKDMSRTHNFTTSVASDYRIVLSYVQSLYGIWFPTLNQPYIANK